MLNKINRYFLVIFLVAVISLFVSARIVRAEQEKSAPSGKVTVLIDTFRRRLIIMDDNTAFADFPIAIGKSKSPSPLGNWKVVGKAKNWGTGFGTRWMQLNVPWGVYGIHGTDKPWSIGDMASHGCFRMNNSHVEKIYPWIKNGTEVIVVGNPFGYMSGGFKRLNKGDKGSDVCHIQGILLRRGFYQGHPDGIYGYYTEKAFLEFQKYYGLDQTGQLGYEEYRLLGLL